MCLVVCKSSVMELLRIILFGFAEKGEGLTDAPRGVEPVFGCEDVDLPHVNLWGRSGWGCSGVVYHSFRYILRWVRQNLCSECNVS